MLALRSRATIASRAADGRGFALVLRRRAPLAAAAVPLLTALDVEAGPRSRPIRTGQTTCYDATGAVVACAGTGQDGDLKRGEKRSYADLGSGTIRDKRAGLTWEKLSDDGSIHDKDTLYTWAEAFEKIDTLNTSSFAGFDDWRLPNAAELATLPDLSKASPPAISAAFTAGCTASCTVLTCSCTPNEVFQFWSSTTDPRAPDFAWGVNFHVGSISTRAKTLTGYVRAVRGGLN